MLQFSRHYQGMSQWFGLHEEQPARNEPVPQSPTEPKRFFFPEQVEEKKSNGILANSCTPRKRPLQEIW